MPDMRPYGRFARCFRHSRPVLARHRSRFVSGREGDVERSADRCDHDLPLASSDRFSFFRLPAFSVRSADDGGWRRLRLRLGCGPLSAIHQLARLTVPDNTWRAKPAFLEVKWVRRAVPQRVRFRQLCGGDQSGTRLLSVRPIRRGLRIHVVDMLSV